MSHFYKRLALALTVLVAAATGAASARVTSLPNPEYVGTLLGTTRGVVELRVNREDGRPTSVRFVARHVEFRCEDGTTRVSSFNIRTAEATGPRSFDTFMARAGGYYRIHAELLGRDRARGFLINYDDPPDPPSYDGPEVECSTVGGRQRWVAMRVDD